MNAIEEVSVLICSRDRPDLLRDAVRSVLEGSRVPEELVVVDQSVGPNSKLEAMETVRGCRVRYLHSETTGLSRARNIGLRAAANEVVVLIDDDMLVREDWLAQLVGGLPDEPNAVATGRVLAAPREGAAGVIPPDALVERDMPAVYRAVQPIDVVPGANVALPRSLTLSLGGYDERLGAGTRYAAADDNDIGHRLLCAGCIVYHVPSAVAFHRAWRTRRELVTLRWRYGRGKGAFYAKHMSLREPFILRRSRADLARRLSRALRALPSSPRTVLNELLSIVGICSGALEFALRERLRLRLFGRARSRSEEPRR